MLQPGDGDAVHLALDRGDLVEAVGVGRVFRGERASRGNPLALIAPAPFQRFGRKGDKRRGDGERQPEFQESLLRYPSIRDYGSNTIRSTVGIGLRRAAPRRQTAGSKLSKTLQSGFAKFMAPTTASRARSLLKGAREATRGKEKCIALE